MMDFGFGSFLEKFQEFYGKGAAKFLVGAIGISILVFCAGLIWSTIVSPVWEWTETTTAGSLVSRLVQVTMLLILVGVFSANLVTAITNKVKVSVMHRVLDRAQESADNAAAETAAMREETIAKLDEIRQVLDRAKESERVLRDSQVNQQPTTNRAGNESEPGKAK